MSAPCFGILLAGGRSTRMGGGDKALREIGGESLLARVIAAMAPQCVGLVLNANGDPARFQAYRLPVIADDLPGFKGPLAGILAGLDWVAANRPDLDLALTAPTDTPFLPSDLALRLDAARRVAGADIACARSASGAHPVIALWPVAIRAELRHALADEDVRKVERFMRRFRLAYAEWGAAPVDPFFNANEPPDLAEAERLAAGESENASIPGK
jgi:molybdopterin-guanine dinucleotide biosynthesis protein A